MSKEINDALQVSLAQNERVRRRQIVAFGMLFIALVGVLVWVGHLATQSATDVRELIVWAVIATVVAVIYGVLALAIYINGTTARLLRTFASIRPRD
jgi:pheromone shutdown protein TraB